MDVAALILWILTAGGGFVLLAKWISKGGARRGGAGSRFPVPLIFGHFLLAAAGLVLWSFTWQQTRTPLAGPRSCCWPSSR